MIRALVGTLSLFLASAAYAATLTPAPCPFEKDAIPEGYSEQCHRMSWTDEGVEFRSSVAVLSPEEADEDTAPVIYLPGGPGDAPVDDEAQPDAILRLFPGRAVVFYNPRGVENTSPRPSCSIPAEYWQEDLTHELERKIISDCHDEVTAQGVRMDLFDPPRLASDVTALLQELEIADAGVFGISYGTETALHLIAEPPGWLRFAILDSVSLPGTVALAEQLEARDAFLNLVDTLCFTNQRCPEEIRIHYDGLTEWVKQFDAHPLSFEIGPQKERWSYDSEDMLDFIAGMSAYPDGAAFSVNLVQALEADPDSVAEFIASEVESDTEYGIDNLPLLLATYSDGVSEEDYAALKAPRAYPIDLEDTRRYLEAYRAWNTEDRHEAPFVTEATKPQPAGLPVLMLSGGVDTATPVPWAKRLNKRFSGMTHYIFPSLGHATAFGVQDDVSGTETVQQMKCAPDAIAAFLSGDEPTFPCGQYRVRMPHE